jgi:hypothetical protein
MEQRLGVGGGGVDDAYRALPVVGREERGGAGVDGGGDEGTYSSRRARCWLTKLS